jgi:hypothetical protein
MPLPATPAQPTGGRTVPRLTRLTSQVAVVTASGLPAT